MTEDELNQKTQELNQKMQDASRTYTARFQRNPDGQFIGFFAVNGDDIPCWLVFDGECDPATDASFLRLSFEEPKS